MIGLGTVVNCAAILLGCAVGLILKKGFPEKWRETIMYGVALSVFLIGVQMAQKSQNVILVILSIVIGSVVGEALDLDGKMNRFGHWVEKKDSGGEKGHCYDFWSGIYHRNSDLLHWGHGYCGKFGRRTERQSSNSLYESGFGWYPFCYLKR